MRDRSIDNVKFNNLAKQLIHGARLGKPVFESDIKKTFIKNIMFMHSRTIAVLQDDAFSICGLRQSEMFSVNGATLFSEIAFVLEYIKNKCLEY